MSASTSMLPPAPILPKGFERPEALNKKVYSKYREMLGTYNDKANSIIQSLPSYMVHEDKGFNLESPREVVDSSPKNIS